MERKKIPEPSEVEGSKPGRPVQKDLKTYRILRTFVERAVHYAKFVLYPVGVLAAVSIFLGYVLARVFIVVECFVALFNSDPGVFEVPSWSAYFPHIT